MEKELTVEETAAKLGISRQTLYELVKRNLIAKYQRPFGRGPGGRRIYFLSADVDALARGETPKPRPEKPH